MHRFTLILAGLALALIWSACCTPARASVVEASKVPTPDASVGSKRSITEWAIHLSRQRVDHCLDELQEFLASMTARPVFARGRMTGLRFGNIKRGSIVDEIGIRDSDILKSVNGEPMDSIQSCYGLFNIFKDFTVVTVRLRRTGRWITIKILID